jgi:hypothetical protein
MNLFMVYPSFFIVASQVAGPLKMNELMKDNYAANQTKLMSYQVVKAFYVQLV